MFTPTAFTLAASGTLSGSTVPAINDQIFNVQNSAFFFPTDRRLTHMYVGGTGLTDAALSSPSLLQNGNPYIYPIDSGAIGGNLPATYRPKNDGLIIPAREQVSLLASHTGAGPDTLLGIMFSTPQLRSKPTGPFKTIKATATGAGGNLVWSAPLTINLTSGLKKGRYTMVGMAAQGTNLIAARLIFPQQVERPGCLATVDAASYEWDDFRFGNNGPFGLFDNDNLPQLEAIGTGALSGTITIYFDYIDVPVL